MISTSYVANLDHVHHPPLHSQLHPTAWSSRRKDLLDPITKPISTASASVIADLEMMNKGLCSSLCPDLTAFKLACFLLSTSLLALCFPAWTMLSFLFSLFTSSSTETNMGKTAQASSTVIVDSEQIKKLNAEDVHLLYAPILDTPLLDSMLTKLGVNKTDSMLASLDAPLADSMVVLDINGNEEMEGLEKRKALINKLIELLQADKENEAVLPVIKDCERYIDQVDKYAKYTAAIESVFMPGDEADVKGVIDRANLTGYKNMIQFYLDHFLACEANEELSNLIQVSSSSLLIGEASLKWLKVSKEGRTQALLLLVLHVVLAEYIRPYYAMEINTAARYAAIEIWCKEQQGAIGSSGALLEARVPDPYYAPLCADVDDDDDDDLDGYNSM